MAISPKNGLLFGGGAVAAALAVAYSAGVFGPLSQDLPAKVTSLTEAPSAKEGRLPGATGKAAADGAKARDDAGTAKPAATPPNPNEDAVKAPVVAPSFDVVRVEGDGSLVVAGKAAGSSKVEILTGSRIVGQTDAGPGGDFAVVLDNPLKPGDYQFVLRSTSPDKVVAMSKETAVVSVPDHPDGQVLAMVETPGEPSKLITVPKAAKDAGGSSSGATASAAGGSGGAAPGSGTDKAAAEEAGQPKPAAPSGEAAGTEAPAGAQTDAGSSGTTAAQAPAGAAPAASAGNTPKETASGKPAAAAGKEATAAAAPEKPDAAAGSAQVGAAGTSAGASAGKAAASPDKASTGKQQPEAPGPKVVIEAVEIEGNKVFVAGSADASHLVRVYANDVMLGESKASAGGRFLVEVVHELPVGDYIVRADLIGDDGEKVIARAAVPFQREPGESVAAVAPSASGTAEKPAAEAGKSPPAEAGGSSSAEARETAGSEKSAGKSEAAASAGGAAAADEPAGKPDMAQPGSPQVQEEAQSGGAAEAGKAAEPSAHAAAQEPPTVVSPKLEETDAAVIIRRRDTLWQISRRVYGHGIRYSTIYLANQDQIRDPDRIWPGQVFRVPDKSHEGDAADMSRLGKQATTVPAHVE